MNEPMLLARESSLGGQDGARLRWRPDPFLPAAKENCLQPEVTLLEGVSEVLKANNFKAPLSVIEIWVAREEFSALHKVPREEWATRLIQPGEFIHVTMPIQGGGGGGSKNPLRTILIVAVVVASMAVSAINPFAGSLVMMGGMLLVNKIAPPSTPKLADRSAGKAEKVWSIDGIQNRADLYSMVPLVLGRARFAPRYAAQPYTMLKGNDQYARYLFCVAGHNKVSDLRIGDTPIENFQGVKYTVHENWQGEEFELYPSAIYQEDMNVNLTGTNGWFYRTTAQDCVELQFELFFSRGLCRINSKNKRYTVEIGFQAEYRKVGDEDWISPFGEVALNSGSSAVIDAKIFDTQDVVPVYLDHSGRASFTKTEKKTDNGWLGFDKIGEVRRVSGRFEAVEDENLKSANLSVQEFNTHPVTGQRGTFISVNLLVHPGGVYKRQALAVSGATLTPVRRGYVLPLEPGQYEFRMRRTTPNSDPDRTDDTVLDDSTWTVFRSLQLGDVLKYDGAPLTVIELEIQASDQLNGQLQEFNALFESYCPVWNGSEWVEQPSNNTAAVAMLVCTSPHIHRTGVNDAFEMLNVDAWQGFYDWCVETGWTYNSVQTGQEVVRQVLSNILSSARASITMSNAKLGVAWDSVDKPVSYPFGPRNSWGFKANKTFVIEQPHGLRVRFLNEERDYQEDERIIYADDYDVTNATNIVEVEFDGVTDPVLIYKHARLRMADSIWRPETYEFNTDFAYLCVDKGDRIQLTHDTPMWGIRQARVQGIKYADYPLYEMNLSALTDLAREHQRLIRPDMSLQEFVDYLETLVEQEIIELIIMAGVKNTAYMSAIVLDDIVSMEQDKEYSLKCFSSGSNSTVYSIKPRDISTNELELFLPIPVSQAPMTGTLAHFGYSNHETHDLIVVGVETADELSAKIYAQDYSQEQIYTALNGRIPKWDSDISLPSRWLLGKLGAPGIVRIVTDEYVLLPLSDGLLLPRIQVTYTLDNSQDIKIQKVIVQVRQKGSEDEWREVGQALGTSNMIYAEGVEEQVTYEVRIYAVSVDEVVSDFSNVHDAYVIGRTTPPPAPKAMHIEGSRIWWEMPAEYPIDVRGWEVFMGFDDTDPFEYALKISNPYTTATEFDVERWSGWSRRVWVRTIDDAGLTSQPVSVAINLGDPIVDNVVVEVLENADRGWPGKVTNGSVFNGHLTPGSASMPFWQGEIWKRDDFWLSSDTASMTYETELTVPQEAVNSWLTLHVDMPDGVLGSVEYLMDNMVEYAPMHNEILVEEEETIKLRITTREGTPGIIREIRWIFDVEDQMETLDDVAVPAGGVRLELEEPFRWISALSFGLQGREGSLGDKVVWIDKGIIENGLVTQGPLIEIKDNAGVSVPGVVDVTVQGAKGVRHE